MLLLLIVLCATAVYGQFPTASNPDSLNIERVGEINLIGTLPASDFPSGADLYVAGNLALMGDFRGIVHIVDISDPTAMRKVAAVHTPGPALDIKIAGNLAAIGVQQRGTDFGLIILDISDPENPVELSRLSEPGWIGVHNLFLHQNHIYIAHAASFGMSIVDISDPTQPFVANFWQHEGGFSNVVHDIFIHGQLAIISDIVSGLIILDISNPDAPATLSSLPFGEGIHSAWAAGNYVYCNQEFGGWERRLYVVDITDPRQPEVVHSFGVRPPPGDAFIGPHNPWVRDGLLYWAYYDGGFRVFDLLDPARPVEIGYHTYAGFAWSAQPHDDGLIYVADSSVGIEAYRLREPAFAIRSVAANPPIAVHNYHQSIAVQVAIAPSVRGIIGTVQRVSARLLNTDPSLTQTLSPDGDRFSGTLAIPADLPTGRHRLHLELEDDRGNIYPFEQAYDLFPDRDREIFIGGFADGWRRTGNIPIDETFFDGRQALALPARFSTTLRVQAPFDPTGYTALRFAFHPDQTENSATNTFAINAGKSTVVLSLQGGDSLAVSLANKRWQTVDVPLHALGLADADPPLEFRSMQITGNLGGASYLADLKFVAATPSPNTAVREEHQDAQPANFTLAPNYPNPFNAATTIRLALPVRTDIELVIYNLSGQKIATLASGERSAGIHSFIWDGRDESGRALASGLYLYRLRAGHHTATRKLTLLR